MKKTVLPLLVSGLAAISSYGMSVTQVQSAPAKCGERTKLVQILKDNYKEVPVSMGISTKNTEAFEIFASKNGSWTVLMTRTNGQTCIMAAGHSWQDLPKHLADVKT